MKIHYKPLVCTLLAAAMVAAAGWYRFTSSVDRVVKTEATGGGKTDGAVPPATMSSIAQNLAKREYHISFDEKTGSLQSPNRKHQLRAYYQPGQLTIKNRVDSAGHNFQLRLKTEGIYADGKLAFQPRLAAETDLDENQLEINHSGFTEQFINDEQGIRQNFIINHAPQNTGKLEVRLVAEGLGVKDAGDNELQLFSDNEKEPALIYKDLKCWDADGKTLTAWLTAVDNKIKISVDVKNAAYPVTVDPLVINGNPDNAAKLESNQAGANAGTAVSSAGDVNGDGYSDVLVGAPLYDNGQKDEGAVFIYYGSAQGLGANPALTLQCNQDSARFGTSVSTAGDVNKDGFSDVIVGAPLYDNGQVDEGAAFVYLGSANGLSNVASVLLEFNQAGANMGQSVALAGDGNNDGYSDLLVGLPLLDNGQADEGGVLVYHGSPAGIASYAHRLLECNQAGARIGSSVAGAGDINGDGYSDMATGAVLYDKGENNEGAVFVYHGSSIGIHPATLKILEVNQANAIFGWSVSTAGDVNGDGYSDLIVGAYQYDNGQNNEGAAFIFHGSAAGILTNPDKTLETNQAEARMGISVACAGDVNGDGYSDVVVGAMYYDNGSTNEGAAFVYQGSPAGVNATAISTLESNQNNAFAGSSVASAGDVNGDGYSDIIVGSPTFDSGQNDEGAAFVWKGGSNGVDTFPSHTLTINQADAQFGFSVAGAGDVNGDGFSDVVVGAPAFDNGQLDEGAAFVYHGSATGLNPNPTLTIKGSQFNAMFGKSVVSAGDVNGDGYGDIAIGAVYHSNGQQYEGAVFVYYGSMTGIKTNNVSMLESNQADALMGRAIGGAGDFNGDGFGDIAVGVEAYDNGQWNEGAIFIYHGTKNGINVQPVSKLESNSAAAYLGYSVAAAGDVNGDGFDDVVAGAPIYSESQSMEGAVHVYNGSPNGIILQPCVILKGHLNGIQLGFSVSSAGDVNSDGFDDIITGAIGYSNGQVQEGAGFLYHGSSSGIADQAPIILESNHNNASMGGSVSSAGDVNGDGYSDIIVGATYYNNGGMNDKSAFLFYGSHLGILAGSVANDVLKISADKPGVLYGTSVCGIGDVNSDGFSDVILGTHLSQNNQIFEGSAFIFYGNIKGLRNNLRLYNSDLATPINQSQKAKNDFGMGLFAQSFLGKGKGKAVWETKPAGQPFSKGSNQLITNSTQLSGQQNVYAPLGSGFELKNVVAKQGPATKVRARIKYDPALALTGQVYGPWRYVPAYLTGNSIAPVPEQTSDEAVKVNGAAEIDGNELIIYPNPVSDKLLVRASGAIIQVRILDRNGKEVLKTSQTEINVGGIETGAYLLVVSYKNGESHSRQVLIRR